MIADSLPLLLSFSSTSVLMDVAALKLVDIGTLELRKRRIDKLIISLQQEIALLESDKPINDIKLQGMVNNPLGIQFSDLLGHFKLPNPP